MKTKRLSADAVFHLAIACEAGKSVPLTGAKTTQCSPVQVLWRDAVGFLTSEHLREVESWAVKEAAEFNASVRQCLADLQKRNGTNAEVKA